MINIFNSTTHYKGFEATNCEKIRINDGKGIQQLRFRRLPPQSVGERLRLLPTAYCLLPTPSSPATR